MKWSTGKKIVVGLMTVGLLFGIYNIVWYTMVQSKYSSYTENMEEFLPNKSYILNTNDGYLYNVKYPDYLSFTGNLGISTNNNKLALIVWPAFLGEDEYGIKIDTENESYEIYVNQEMKANTQEENEILSQYQEDIEILFEKANEQWNLF